MNRSFDDDKKDDAKDAVEDEEDEAKVRPWRKNMKKASTGESRLIIDVSRRIESKTEDEAQKPKMKRPETESAKLREFVAAKRTRRIEDEKRKSAEAAKAKDDVKERLLRLEAERKKRVSKDIDNDTIFPYFFFILRPRPPPQPRNQCSSKNAD